MYTRHWITLGLVLALSLPSVAAAGEAENKAMATQIANTIRDSGKLTNFRIGVKFEDGKAVLLGDVTDSSQAKAAERVAKQIAGVDSVVNQLKYAKPTRDTKAANALHLAAPAVKAPEQSGLLLSLGGMLNRGEEEVVQTSVNKPGNKIASAKNKPTAPGSKLKRLASRPKLAPSPKKTTSRRSAPKRVAQRSNNMPMPVAYSGQGGRPMQARGQMQARGPVQPVNHGAYGPRPAGYQPGAQGVGFESPSMPGYAWPSYAAPQNYSALTYPKQYSPTAWPYIGPFYPYPQVPLGWREVTLEWDDGWWFLDFSHGQRH